MSGFFISIWWDLFIGVLLLCGLLCLLILYQYTYWEKKGVKGPKPLFLVGNIKDLIFGKAVLGENFADLYFQTKGLPYSGFYMITRPTLLVNDLDLIKTVLVKDFVHFSDHSVDIDPKYEPLAAHLFNLNGEKWKKLRIKLTPTFTSSKIKNMFETVAQCGIELTNFVDKEVIMDDEMDVKELLAKFNTDVIGSCAFGLECNSFKNPDAIFRKMGKKIFEATPLRSFIEFMVFFWPTILPLIKFSILGKEVNDFFYNTVNNTIKYREENNIVRNDFLQLLMQLKNEGSIKDESTGDAKDIDDGTRLTTMQLAAQVFVFFLAGFETSSTTASFALYELALNPEVQETLREEISAVLAKHNGVITYDSLGEMTYLTKVIEETLRKYPPLPMIFRVCTQTYVLPGTDITIDKGTPVMIPILGIQRDPAYYPDPMKFDPERFTPENKASRHHFSYLPFGEGPRICIGSRFGMMQTRLGLVSILSKYKVSVCERTNIPMKYDNKTFILTSNGGVWLKLTKRGK